MLLAEELFGVRGRQHFVGWRSNLYGKGELLHQFERAGFSHVTFKAFPLSVRYLAGWGYVIEAWNKVQDRTQLQLEYRRVRNRDRED